MTGGGLPKLNDMTGDAGATEQSLSLDQLARRYGAALKRFFAQRLERSAPAADSEDLVQEVFVRISNRQDAVPIGNAKSYLFTTAGNVLRDRARRRASHAAAEHDVYDDAHDLREEPATDRVILGREAVKQLAAALEELPERVQTVFLLHRFEGLRYHEIAEKCGLSQSAVEKYMSKAIRHIEKRLRHHL